MAICKLMSLDVPRYAFTRVKVPANTTAMQGNILVRGALSDTRGEYNVYASSLVADRTTEFPGIIINQREELLSDGRKPGGQPDPGDYTYTAGEVITIVEAHLDLIFEMTSDSYDGTAVKGQYLVPQGTANLELTVSASIPSNVKVAFLIERVTTYNTGLDLETAVQVRVVAGK